MSKSESPIRIVLWRHGQTDWNVENRFQGSSDIPLNKVGESQVVEAAKVLAALKPDRIVSSDLIRAQKTAAALAKLTNKKLRLIQILERQMVDFGRVEQLMKIGHPMVRYLQVGMKVAMNQQVKLVSAEVMLQNER